MALPVLYAVSRYNYNLFHCLIDGVSIVIAACVFAIIWYSRRLVDNHFFLYIGIAFLYFAFWDSLHLLGNKGMGVLPEYGNLGPALYIVSRYVLSISLLIAPLFIKRRLNTALMFGVYSLATLLILLSIFHWKTFPACFVEGVGLTPFKVVSDYVVCLILLAAMGLLLINRDSFDPRVLRIIVSSIILSIATGLTFTLYSDPFGITNLIGHLFQIASFYLVFLAFIETGLTKPQEILFRKLKQSEEKEKQQNRILEGINRIFGETITCKTEQELGDVCLEVIEALTESAVGFIGEIRTDGHLYNITISNPGWEACTMADRTGHRRAPGRFRIVGLYGRVLKDGRSLLANDPARHPDSIGIPEGHPPLTAFLGTPLIREGKTVGLIAVGNREGGYTPEQQRIMEALAPIVLQALLKKRAEAELQASETRFRAFFESAAVGTAELGPDGSFLNVNQRLCEITGYSIEEMLRMNILDLSPPDELQHNREIMAAYLHGRESLVDMECRCRRKNGGIIWARFTAAIIRGEDGKILMSAAIAIDITKRRLAEEALNLQSAKLEAANRELESFAYSVSHDLRAPLRAIDGFSRMLLRKTADKLNEDERRQFEVIRENTQRMGRLIDDLLSFSRLGRQAISLSDIDMVELARRVWEELLTINPGRRMTLKMDGLPAAFADGPLVSQVWANLLSNAVKFTRNKEEALIEIGGRTEDHEAVYYVRDNGAGFDMKQCEKLFGVFQRLHGESEFEGTGAGLAIVQRIIHRHGGRVWGEGEVEKGATFYFTLPTRK
ncbi:MAG: PAS domain S-box protein [Deltaproteobacteria bacterium]|nr:PAS domain S-box protein [Deltaproteobacteria bacterium]